MAEQEHTTVRPRTPGQIEMEGLRERAARLQGYHSTHMDIEGPIMDAVFMADLAMTWWEQVRNERTQFARVTNTNLCFTDRDLGIASFAFGDLWHRLKAIDERMAQTRDEA